MNLPTIETPRYTCTLPNSNIEVSYRPFLVGEQKSLLIAQEAEDNKNTIKEMYRLLDVCTDVDAYKLESLDLEFLFLKLLNVFCISFSCLPVTGTSSFFILS